MEPDALVIRPDGSARYVGYDPRESPGRAALRLVGEPVGTQGMGRLRVYFADDMGGLEANPAADRLMRAIGYRHPYGWRGTVVVTMEEDSDGDVAPLTATVRASLDEVLLRPRLFTPGA